MNVSNWVKKNASTILTCFGAGGMVTTVGLAIRATLKARAACIDARIEKDRDELTKMEIFRISAPIYIPTVAVGTASLVCVFGANALNKRQQAAMASAYTALASAFEGYRGKVEAICGPGTNAAIEKAIEQERRDKEDDHPPWDEAQTFYLECCYKPTFFERTMEQVMHAEYHFNRNFRIRGWATLNEFLEFLELPKVDGGDDVGWDDYIGEIAFGYKWIDFNHRYFETDDGLMVCSIDMPFEPHPLHEEDFNWTVT